MSRKPKQAPGEAADSESKDLNMVQAALRGDPVQREALGRRLLIIPRIMRGINARMGGMISVSDLDDLAQDVFVVVWRKLDQFHGAGGLDPWVYRICQFRYLNFRRGKRTQSQRHVAAADEVLQGVPAPSKSESMDPRIDRMLTSMSTLNEDFQEIILLHHLDGLTFQEVADRKQINVNKLKSRYYRGLDSLRKSLGVTKSSPGDPKPQEQP